MNFEEARLRTFIQWPSDSVVSPQRIAKAGFFSTQQGLEVECFACNVRISEWNYGDQVMNRHIALSPTCPFVLDPSTSNNVPMIQPNVPSSSSRDFYHDERTRLESFENWPATHIVTPERLARAGFYYLKEGDNTKCAFCKGVVRAWEPGDDPDAEHQRHFPHCSFVISTINPRLNNGTGESQGECNFNIDKDVFPNINLVRTEQNLGELGVQAHKGPKRSNFATVEARLNSFTGWSADLIQTPDILSQAGFYYEGMGDQVRCFHCDGGLKHWDPHDDPWTEHARWFPNCSFIKLVKGHEFVTACALEHSTGSSRRDSSQKVQSSRRRREVTDRELQGYLSSPPALTALSIGLNVERVKRAIKEKIEQTGRAYSHPDALVEAALNLQHEEEDPSSNDQEDSQLGNCVRHAVSTVLRDIVKNSEPRIECCSSASPPVVPENQTQIKADIPQLEKSVSLEEENRILKEARLCKICMDGEVGIVFLPCGHLATCVNCAPNLEDCPVCRSSIKATVRTFLS